MDEQPINNLKERYLALDSIETAARERLATIQDEKELQKVNRLIKRAFLGECWWDKRNQGGLLTLAIRPEAASRLFRFGEFLHSLLHRH